MEISNPRRILAVSLTNSAQHLSNVIKDLTGIHPTSQPPSSSSETDTAPETSTIAGTTHPLPLTTPYYTASVPVWLDLVSSPADWAASFLSPEAKEVLEVLGGVVVVFEVSSSSLAAGSSSGSGTEAAATGGGLAGQEQERELVRQMGRVVREGLGGWGWDGVGLAVGVGGNGASGENGLEEWEDLCAEAGLEFVHVPKAGGVAVAKKGDEQKRNEFGERVGVARVLEALEANDWSGGDIGGYGEDAEDEDEEVEGEKKDDEFDPESLGFGFDRDDFVGLRRAIWGGGGGDEEGSKGEGEGDEEGDEDDVQKMERMMSKLHAVRDASAGLPEEQRKRMAARAVAEVMKEL